MVLLIESTHMDTTDMDLLSGMGSYLLRHRNRLVFGISRSHIVSCQHESRCNHCADPIYGSDDFQLGMGTDLVWISFNQMGMCNVLAKMPFLIKSSEMRLN